MTTDEQYVPTEGDVRARYVLAGLPDCATSDQIVRTRDREAPEFDRFLARVRRDAAREAMHALRTHLAASRGHQLIGPDGLDYYIHNHHPEETP